MQNEKYNCVVLLGPTAVGKTSLGVRIASNFGWDIISADSRQVYCGLDLGSGKDLDEYSFCKQDGSIVKVPYHLINVTTLKSEYNVFNFQSDFYELFSKMTLQNKMPFIVGGTGMYLDSVVRGYSFTPVPENKELRCQLEAKSLEELDKILLQLKPDLHNKSDLALKERVVRAIEIQLYTKEHKEEIKAKEALKPKINALVLGTTIPRDLLHKNIEVRLMQRLDSGMIEEVQNLYDSGFSWERLEKLGLEYRFISEYLEGKIKTKEEMIDLLYHAICQFAKRQETWFRGMQKKGVKIHWLPCVADKEAKYLAALDLINLLIN